MIIALQCKSPRDLYSYFFTGRAGSRTSSNPILNGIKGHNTQMQPRSPASRRRQHERTTYRQFLSAPDTTIRHSLHPTARHHHPTPGHDPYPETHYPLASTSPLREPGNCKLSGGNRRFSLTGFLIRKRGRIAVGRTEFPERLTSCSNALLCVRCFLYTFRNSRRSVLEQRGQRIGEVEAISKRHGKVLASGEFWSQVLPGP
jgi:hypothetical protein